MQKIRAFFTYTILFSLIIGVFFPIGVSFAWKDKYDYSEYIDKINTTGNILSDGILEGELHFDSPRTTFIFAFDQYRPSSSEDIEVITSVDGIESSRYLDIEGVDDLSRVTTFPLVTDARTSLKYRIIFHTKDFPRNISLISSDQESQGKYLSYEPYSSEVGASSDVRIISRSEWGADESLRYVSKERQAEKRQEWIDRGKTSYIIEETADEREHRLQADNEYNAIAATHPESSTTYSLKRYEGENKLFWPIKKAKKIDRIVIHHTAENLDKTADDMTLLRAIYFYHTKTKGWGDIGYNFIVGQRGAIYEGRAGGDYVEGAHVYGNNMGTVGISLIGNYETLHLNKDQKEGMLEAIEYVVRKYGINIDEQDIGASLCAKGSDCIWRKVITPKLIGHRDLASTSCPGRNFYELLPELRNTIVGKVGKLQPVYNVANSTIDPVDPEDMIEYRLKGSSPTPASGVSSPKVITRITSSGGKPIKIRLSYPESDSISIQTTGNKAGRLMWDKKSIPYIKGRELTIQKKGNNTLTLTLGKKTYEAKSFSLSSDIVRINSWSRVPLWDTLGKYNDNIFRGKITIRNIDGKLLVVNELPIEDYLKGLGEVSNNDLTEKVKTIIVAARTYAYFYRDPKNRKYHTTLYDGSDNPDEFQRYLGYGYELRSPEVTKQVKSTKGQVIRYKNELTKAWYFSSSDGKTRSYKEYCETNNPGKTCEDIPYLQSVDDPGGNGRTRSGHGVGISGVGATYFASQGWDYKKILQYFMKGVEIGKI